MKSRFEQMNPMNAKEKIRLLSLLFSKPEPIIAGRYEFYFDKGYLVLYDFPWKLEEPIVDAYLLTDD